MASAGALSNRTAPGHALFKIRPPLNSDALVNIATALGRRVHVELKVS
ncbi:MAG: hypothetical protein KF722_03465 [Nitrospira sp.]|nr:hypothetical protein [Nitrospira sp.]